MAYFRIMLHGDGILCRVNDSPPIIGFYTTRIVRAPASDVAKIKALEMVRANWETGHEGKWNHGAAPHISVESVSSASFLAYLLHRNRGHSFYSNEENDD